ncbi:hypothetical protein PybrP1_010550 [[Pythium] brassicae (nom. inval.)]|nr:hypothetical protein PybrP1_010550 [[Pythium] brassicae (nom. inval.)]
MYTGSPSFTDLPLSARLARVLAAGVLDPPLALVDNAPPPDVRALLDAHSLRWPQLDGNLQRLLLWDSGFVVSGAQLARVFVRCGLAMDDIPLPRAAFEQLGCVTHRCRGQQQLPDAETDVWRADASAAACPDTAIAQIARCAVLDATLEPTAAPLWSQEANNTDVPRPRVFRNSARSFSIQLGSDGSQSASAAPLSCPARLRLSVPCTTFEAGAKWCVPKPSGHVDPLLADLQRRIVSSSSIPQDRGGLGSLPLGVWVAAAALSVVAIALCLTSHVQVQRRKQRVAAALYDRKLSEDSADRLLAQSAAALAFAPVLNVQPMQQPQLQPLGDSSSRRGYLNHNGLAKSASYSDLIGSSEVMMAFQCDPLVLAKRVPMVDLAFQELIGQGASGEIYAGRLHGCSGRVALKQVLRVQAIRIARMVVNDEIKPALTPACPAFVRMIARACLHHDPDKRPSARELLLYFADPSRCSFDWAAWGDASGCSHEEDIDAGKSSAKSGR